MEGSLLGKRAEEPMIGFVNGWIEPLPLHLGGQNFHFVISVFIIPRVLTMILFSLILSMLQCQIKSSGFVLKTHG